MTFRKSVIIRVLSCVLGRASGALHKYHIFVAKSAKYATPDISFLFLIYTIIYFSSCTAWAEDSASGERECCITRAGGNGCLAGSS